MFPVVVESPPYALQTLWGEYHGVVVLLRHQDTFLTVAVAPGEAYTFPRHTPWQVTPYAPRHILEVVRLQTVVRGQHLTGDMSDVVHRHLERMRVHTA